MNNTPYRLAGGDWYPNNRDKSGCCLLPVLLVLLLPPAVYFLKEILQRIV